MKNQIGFCGIWCGSCISGNGALVELARRFDEIAKSGIEKWVPKPFDFQEFKKGLAQIQKMSLCPGCRKGGGNPSCKIRICALQKGFTDCNHCSLLVSCKNFGELEGYNPKIKEQLIATKNADRKTLIEK